MQPTGNILIVKIAILTVLEPEKKKCKEPMK